MDNDHDISLQIKYKHNVYCPDLCNLCSQDREGSTGTW
jgi:hypothetical protein